jgi:hypothetical protein
MYKFVGPSEVISSKQIKTEIKLDTYENVCNVIEYSSNKCFASGCRHPKVLLLFQDV